MLEDEALTAPAFARDRRRAASADDAWVDALDAEIAGYEAADDEYFRARAADSKDIRDRVLACACRRRRASRAAGRDPGRRGHHADALPGDRLEPAAASRCGGQHRQPRRDAGALARRADGGRPRRRRARRSTAKRCSTASMAASCFDPELGRDRELSPGRRMRFAERRARRRELPGTPRRDRRRHGGAGAGQHRRPAPTSTAIDIGSCDGVGLMRTEFLFGRRAAARRGDAVRAYRKVLEWADGKPVTIRTLDAGGDKPVPGFTVEESNPFLGLRGIRLSLARPEVFRVQLRALRAPPCTATSRSCCRWSPSPTRSSAPSAMFAEEAADARRARASRTRMPPLGIMVEVPAVAIAPEALRRGRLLLHRLQRPDAVCHGGGARQARSPL